MGDAFREIQSFVPGQGQGLLSTCQEKLNEKIMETCPVTGAAELGMGRRALKVGQKDICAVQPATVRTLILHKGLPL